MCPVSGWAHKAGYVMALLGLPVPLETKPTHTHTRTATGFLLSVFPWPQKCLTSSYSSTSLVVFPFAVSRCLSEETSLRSWPTYGYLTLPWCWMERISKITGVKVQDLLVLSGYRCMNVCMDIYKTCALIFYSKSHISTIIYILNSVYKGSRCDSCSYRRTEKLCRDLLFCKLFNLW